MVRNFFTAVVVTVMLIGIGGCAPKEPVLAQEQTGSLHINVPFIAPRTDRCASTSLEMVSSYWQSVSAYRPSLVPEELDKRTLIPEKEGTVTIELTATARADGLLVYPLKPSFDALFSELQAGNPVIVLVNRGYSWHPLWHYTTVTGYDASKRAVLSHFADHPDEAISLSTFSELWKRSGQWAIVPVPPERIPATANAKEWLRSAYDLESTGMFKEAMKAYTAGVHRWPQDQEILFALANAQYKAGQYEAAEQSYRKLLVLNPDHPFGLNNLADLLCRQGKGKEAAKLLEREISADEKTQVIMDATKAEIKAGCPSSHNRP